MNSCLNRRSNKPGPLSSRVSLKKNVKIDFQGSLLFYTEQRAGAVRVLGQMSTTKKGETKEDRGNGCQVMGEGLLNSLNLHET